MAVPNPTRRHREENGGRYVAEDVGRRSQHAVWEHGRVVWKDHRQGGTMQTFTGPDEVWKALIAESRPY